MTKEYTALYEAMRSAYNALYDIHHASKDKDIRKICIKVMTPLWEECGNYRQTAREEHKND